MTDKNEWEVFFNGHAPIYMENPFTVNTIGEVEFLLDELKLPPQSSILDIGCGTGRHAVELARRGYQITGVDISSRMLAEGEKTAREAGIRINWIHSDATSFTSNDFFDAAICICEGAFGLLGTADDPIGHDLDILRNVYTVLKPKAQLFLTMLNGYRMARKHSQKEVEDGKFNPLILSETSSIESDTPEGTISLPVRERGYVPTELVLLFRMAGFQVEHIWGGTAGNWGRRPLELDEMEIMVVARKTATPSLL